MCLRVCRVVELSENNRARNGSLQLVCLGNGTLHSLCALRKNKLCPVCLEKGAALNAHGIRKRKNCTIASCCCNESNADAGVAACGLNDRCTGLQLAALFCVIDHSCCDSVLDRARRIEILQLRDQLCIRDALLRLKICQLQKRCVSDQFCCALINLCHLAASFLPVSDPFPVSSGLLPVSGIVRPGLTVVFVFLVFTYDLLEYKYKFHSSSCQHFFRSSG